MLTILRSVDLDHIESVKSALFVLYVLATAGVIVGVYWEADKFTEAKRHRGWRVLLWSLAFETFLTVAIFACDAEVSERQRSRIGQQNEQIILLQERIADRDLTEEQQKSIAAKIRKFAGTPYDLSMHVDREPMLLLDKVEDALVLGQWTPQPLASSELYFDRSNRSHVGMRTVGGIWVLYSKKSEQRIADAAKELWGALRAEGLFAKLVTLDPGDAKDIGVIHVWVGMKMPNVSERAPSGAKLK